DFHLIDDEPRGNFEDARRVPHCAMCILSPHLFVVGPPLSPFVREIIAGSTRLVYQIPIRMRASREEGILCRPSLSASLNISRTRARTAPTTPVTRSRSPTPRLF